MPLVFYDGSSYFQFSAESNENQTKYREPYPLQENIFSPVLVFRINLTRISWLRITLNITVKSNVHEYWLTVEMWKHDDIKGQIRLGVGIWATKCYPVNEFAYPILLRRNLLQHRFLGCSVHHFRTCEQFSIPEICPCVRRRSKCKVSLWQTLQVRIYNNTRLLN